MIIIRIHGKTDLNNKALKVHKLSKINTKKQTLGNI